MDLQTLAREIPPGAQATVLASVASGVNRPSQIAAKCRINPGTVRMALLRLRRRALVTEDCEPTDRGLTMYRMMERMIKEIEGVA